MAQIPAPLSAERLVDGYQGAPLSNLGAARLEPELRKRFAPYQSSYKYFGDRKIRYRPNAWGLFDMHGNAAEWTLSNDAAYPYRSDDGRNAPACEGRKVVRGGSFYDRPKRCRSAFRLTYPAWQKVHNVGFRVVGTWPRTE